MTKGFLGNQVAGKNLKTAIGGKFYEGFTTMYISDLNEKVEGNDLLLDVNLKALLPYKEELKAGKRVDVHLEWELTEDHMDYKTVELLEVKVNDKE